MGSSQSSAKDGGNQESEQQEPAEERGCFLAHLVTQGGRLITPNPNPDTCPETNTANPAADTDIAGQLQATETAGSAEASFLADAPDQTAMKTLHASPDHGDASVDQAHPEPHLSQDDEMTSGAEQKKSKKKSKNKRKKAKAKNRAVTSHDVVLDDSAPQQTIADREEQLESSISSLQPTQAQPQLTPIVEEDEDTLAIEAGKAVQDDTVTTQDPGGADPARQQIQEQTAQPATTPATTGGMFRFDNFHPETRCREPECRKSTHPLDGSTKTCPACGPRSKVRYCTKTCLYKDIRRHFLNECGQLSIEGGIDESTLDDANKPVRPYLRHGTEEMVNTVERHRQAVYFAIEQEGEYFIFDDVEECESDSPTAEAVQDVRGTGKCVYPVFVSDKTTKEYFRRSLMNALTWGTTNEGSTKHCEVLAGMVILDLKAHGEWDQQMCTYLCMQMGFESKHQIPAGQQV